jgi:translation elongation factor EF-Ts
VSIVARYIETYNHNNRIGVLVEFRAIDDFTFRTEEFQALAKEIALHIAACNPAGNSYGNSLVALLDQRLLRDESRSVRDMLEACEAELKGRLRVQRYVRYATDENDE